MAHHSDMIAEDIEQYLKMHENKGLLRFITCGSVDDGKSTLIGRLLHDSKMIFEDQLAAIEKDSKKMGTQGGELDLALLVDGLQSEREQGITIDVAYRFFSTDKRKFIIADTPGHEQYTRNMATGASTADLAIILIDARHGVQTQTRRHSYIVSLLGIRHMIVAVNKMDLVDFSQERFESIKAQYDTLIPTLPNHDRITFEYLPLSALTGDNVVYPSENMPWHRGIPLMEMLDTLSIDRIDDERSEFFRFPVQYVNRPHLDFRGFCGTIASGSIKVGDQITVLPSGKTTRIRSIVLPTIPDFSRSEKIEPSGVDEAFAPMAVTLTTQDEVDISRGDMIVHSNHLPRISNTLKVTVVWMSEEAMNPTKSYYIKSASTVVSGSFAAIHYKIDVNTYNHETVEELGLNDIASCTLLLSRSIPYDPYSMNRTTGSFIVIDRSTNNTVGAGMIIEADDSKNTGDTHRVYTDEEIELNAYIRKNFPEWGCKAI
jgi:sulfate adenylyltransferase subunit 1